MTHTDDFGYTFEYVPASLGPSFFDEFSSLPFFECSIDVGPPGQQRHECRSDPGVNRISR